MALRYRNDYVLSSLRTAYSLKYCDDSLLLAGGYDVFSKERREPGDIEADLASLSLRLQLDSNGAPSASSSSIQVGQETPDQEGTGVNNIGLNDLKGDSDSSVPATQPESPSKPQALAPINEFELNIEDDSDFEDDILQATQDIEYEVEPASRKSEVFPKINARGSPSRSNQQAAVDMKDVFVKRPVKEDGEPTRSSKLTSKLSNTHRDPREQYLEAVAGLDTSGVKGVQFKMHFRDREAMSVVVKQDCTAHLAIGYALLRAGIEPGDANMYNLRIVEDDGEPDEDFPALDRTRPIASYHVDEFAIVRATDAEYRDNAKRTPNKISFKGASSSNTDNYGNHGAPVLTNAASSKLLMERDRIEQASKMQQEFGNFAERKDPHETARRSSSSRRSTEQDGREGYGKTGSLTIENEAMKIRRNSSRASDSRLRGTKELDTSYSSSLSGAKMDTVAVKIYMHPYDPILSQVFWKDDMVPKQNRLKDVFEQMCRDKMMDSDMYVLRKADSSNQIIKFNSVISNLIPPPTVPEAVASVNSDSQAVVAAPTANEESTSVSFVLIARRNLPPSQQIANRPRSSSRATLGSDTGNNPQKEGTGRSSSDLLQPSVLAMQPLGFYKYPVLRRQQMNFLGRSERELVIDGEYIHIMPPTDWSLLDQPKTTTFHIRKVLRVKKSRKVPTNFSIIVMKATGPKRYDLESTDTRTTAEIVDLLQNLRTVTSKSLGI